MSADRVNHAIGVCFVIPSLRFSIAVEEAGVWLLKDI